MRWLYRLRLISVTLLDLISARRDTQRTTESLTLARMRELQQDEHPIGILPYGDTSVAALVWELKYYANARAVALAATLVHERMLAACEESLGTPLLLHVPARPLHVRERGHDALALVCRRVAAGLAGSVDYDASALSATRETLPQRGLSREARQTNVAHSLAASPSVAGRTCVVLDDVVTTGATLGEARRALVAAGASSVVTLALAWA